MSDSGPRGTIEYCEDSAPRDCITESEGSHDSGDEEGKCKGPTGKNTDPEAEPNAAEAVGDERESGEGLTGKSNQPSAEPKAAEAPCDGKRKAEGDGPEQAKRPMTHMPEDEKAPEDDEGRLCWPSDFWNWKAPTFSAGFAEELVKVALSLVDHGKGLLACDESHEVISCRFQSAHMDNHAQNRIGMREILFKTDGLSKFISGAILVEEELLQCDSFDNKLVKVLKERGIIPGIKADEGLKALIGGGDNEKWTAGLDNLDSRSQGYYENGARFASWRTVFKVDVKGGCPTKLMLEVAAHNFARFARNCQENGLVPIVEVEILQVGSHSVEVTARVMRHILMCVYAKLQSHGVLLRGSLLRMSMVTPGVESREEAGLQVVAEKTVETLDATLPPSVPGVCFLSGALSDENAARALSLMTKVSRKGICRFTFSFSDRLQERAIQTWRGRAGWTAMAQHTVIKGAEVLSECSQGRYCNDLDGF